MKAAKPLNQLEFERHWTGTVTSDDDLKPLVIETAYRRYTQLQSNPPKPQPQEPSITQLEAAFQPSLSHEKVKSSAEAVRTIYINSRRLPWTKTGIWLKKGQQVSIFATGRVWRSKILNLWLAPQWGLWCRVGVNGDVFNGTHDTNTFAADEETGTGELFLASQFPGHFGEKRGGRVSSNLWAYEKIGNGGYAVMIVAWKEGVDVEKALASMKEQGDAFDLITTELDRRTQMKRKENQTPAGWKYLWFIGNADHFTQSTDESQKCIHCRPNGKVGIIQKELVIPFTEDTAVSWDWINAAIPSRLREDTTLTHDYLSVAIEFENGRDITYHWSWELPVDFGYWCPIPVWHGWEYHVVLRSGTEGLGVWFSEKRDLYADYKRYIGGEIPSQIVRCWLIAGNRWQRFEGDMSVKNWRLTSKESGDVEVI